MGGSSLLMAAHRDPSQFARLVLFEPIARPPEEPPVDASAWPIVLGARRRKRQFPSFQAAFENFRRKPPLSAMTAEALRGYVEHGLRPTHDGGVELCCPPGARGGDLRARAAQRRVGPAAGDRGARAGRVGRGRARPTVGVGGARSPSDSPAASSVVLPDQGHLGPFSHPRRGCRRGLRVRVTPLTYHDGANERHDRDRHRHSPGPVVDRAEQPLAVARSSRSCRARWRSASPASNACPTRPRRPPPRDRWSTARSSCCSCCRPPSARPARSTTASPTRSPSTRPSRLHRARARRRRRSAILRRVPRVGRQLHDARRPAPGAARSGSS